MCDVQQSSAETFHACGKTTSIDVRLSFEHWLNSLLLQGNNQITSVAAHIGSCAALTALALHGNGIARVPPALKKLKFEDSLKEEKEDASKQLGEYVRIVFTYQFTGGAL